MKLMMLIKVQLRTEVVIYAELLIAQLVKQEPSVHGSMKVIMLV